MTRYTEDDILWPALRLLRDNPPGLKTPEIIEELMRIMKPDGADLEKHAGRQDTKFSQTARNLLRTSRIEAHGFIEKEDDTFRITKSGKQRIEDENAEAQEIGESLRRQGFSRKTVEKEQKHRYKDVVVEEGTLEIRNVKQRKRSKRLRDLCIKEFMKKNGGKLFCIACGFDYEKKYGKWGENYIEIHHTSPVHMKDEQGEREILGEALRHVVPLCSNCHRMVHRIQDKPLSVEELRKKIR